MIYALGTPGEQPRLFMSSSNEAQVALNTKEGEVVIEVDDDAKHGRWTISGDGKALVAYEPSLDEAKADKWALTKRIRAKAMALGCWTPEGIIDTDPVSLSMLMVHMTQSMIDPFYAADLTMADDTVVRHRRGELRDAFAEVSKFVSAVHARSVALRQAINDATSIEALERIDPTQDWPEVDQPQP